MEIFKAHKWLVIITATVVVLALASFFMREVRSIPKGDSVGKVKIYSGSAVVNRSLEENENLGNDDNIYAGDLITVADSSRLALELKDNTIARLEAGSRVKVREAKYSAEGKISSVDMELISGKMWNKVQPLDAGANYKTETPVMVAAVRGTEYNLEHFGLRSLLQVFGGVVAAGDKASPEKPVTAGSAFIVDKSGPSSTPEPRPMQPGEVDEWIEFNLSEDRSLLGLSQAGDLASRLSESTDLLDPEKVVVSPGLNSGSGTKTPATTTGGSGTPTTQTPQAKVKSVSLTATKTTLNVNESIILTTEVTYDDGTKSKPTSGISWQQSKELGAFQGNYFRGILAGTTDVKAAVGGVASNGVSLTIQNSQQTTPQNSLTVSCVKQSNPNNLSGLPRGVCQAIYQPGQVNVSSQAEWQVTGNAAGSVDGGYYYPEQQGSATLTAVYNGVSGKTTISIP